MPLAFWSVGPLLGFAFRCQGGWAPIEKSSFFEVCGLTEPLIGLAVFVELVLVIGPLFSNQGPTETNRQLARAVVRTNAGLMLVAQGAALYAIGSGSSSVFLLFSAVTPMVLQILLIIDCAYQRVGINRVREG